MLELPEGLPQYSLGWGVLSWCSDNLAQPDGDHKGEKWRFSREQAKFVVWFYAVDEEGKFIYRRGLLGRVKGWGKSPLLAALCCAELLGPVKFSHWENGKPVGRTQPSPWVQISATSEAQTDNTMDLVVEMLLNGEACENYRLDIGKTRILTENGKLEPVTAGSTSREGNRPTFVVLDETHLWVKSNHGDKLAAVIRRNLGKFGGRSVETTNAPAPGEESVAELSLEAAKASRPGLLVDYRAASDSCPAKIDDNDPDAEQLRAERRKGLCFAYGDSAAENGGWVDLDRIEEEMDDPATTEADARRFYFNQVVQGTFQWLDPAKWRSIIKFVPFEEIGKTERIALGFDGSTKDDTTALIGCRLSDGHIFTIEVWANPDPKIHRDWEVPFVMVDEKVRKVLAEYNVVWMYADPAYWQDIVGRWSLDFDDIVFEYWTNRKNIMSRAIERFETAVESKLITWDGSAVLEQHALNAQFEETPYGKLIKKEARGSSRKIDAVMAALLALEARADAIEDGRDTDGPDNYLFSF